MSDTPDATEQSLLHRLRAGDEAAFTTVVDGLNGRLLALARTFTSSPALAEDIVQETWLAVIRGLRGFEGRSTLRTWIFSILVRRARTMAARDARRSNPRPAPGDAVERSNGEWTHGSGKVGLWTDAPVPWSLVDPASLYQSLEALQVIRNAIDGLPERQRQALLLRDVEDLSTKDVCNILEISETNFRVLIHRGRARVRQALDHYLRGIPTPRARVIPDSSGRSISFSSPSNSAIGDKR